MEADFLGQVLANRSAGAMGETSAFLNPCKQFHSADHRFAQDPVLRAERTDGLTSACFLTSPSKGGLGTSTANLVTIWPLNRLLPGPTAGLSFCCWPRSASPVLPGLFNNRSQTGSSSQGCLYAKVGKHKSGQQTCKRLLFIPSILPASFSSLIFLPSLPCCLETHLIVAWDDKCPLPQCPFLSNGCFPSVSLCL